MHREVLMERLYYKALWYLFALVSVIVVMILVLGSAFSLFRLLVGLLWL